MFSIGAALLLIGISGCKHLQGFLGKRVFTLAGSYSFSYILLHIPVIASFSCWQYLFMSNLGLSKWVVTVSVLIAAIPVHIIANFLFQKLTVPLTDKVVMTIRSHIQPVTD